MRWPNDWRHWLEQRTEYDRAYMPRGRYAVALLILSIPTMVLSAWTSVTLFEAMMGRTELQDRSEQLQTVMIAVVVLFFSVVYMGPWSLRSRAARVVTVVLICGAFISFGWVGLALVGMLPIPNNSARLPLLILFSASSWLFWYRPRRVRRIS